MCGEQKLRIRRPTRICSAANSSPTDELASYLQEFSGDEFRNLPPELSILLRERHTVGEFLLRVHIVPVISENASDVASGTRDPPEFVSNIDVVLQGPLSERQWVSDPILRGAAGCKHQRLVGKAVYLG